MLVHVYDETTGEYLHDWKAQESPLEPGVFIKPTASTNDPLPPKQAKKWPVRVNNTWELHDDFRGEIWFSGDGKRVEITEIGTPSGLTKTAPPSPVIRAPSNQEIRLQIALMTDTDLAIKGLLEAIEDRLGIPRETLKNDALTNYPDP